MIEIGSYQGGSALWFADQAGLLGLGLEVLSIDIEKPVTVAHPSVTFLQGDARELGTVLTPALMNAVTRPPAVEAFLEQNAASYEIDRGLCDYFGRNVTWNVNGYLRRL